MLPDYRTCCPHIFVSSLTSAPTGRSLPLSILQCWFADEAVPSAPRARAHGCCRISYRRECWCNGIVVVPRGVGPFRQNAVRRALSAASQLCRPVRSNPEAGLIFFLAVTIAMDDGLPIKVIGECSSSLDWGAYEAKVRRGSPRAQDVKEAKDAASSCVWH